MRALVLALAMLSCPPLKACDLALLLAVDVSGSVDRREFEIQMQGLGAALRDGVVADALVAQKAKVSLLQWTGETRQKITIPWTQIRNHTDAYEFAARVENDARIWRNYSTAIGEALKAAEAALDIVPDCRRHVIDLSGDGASNEGLLPNGPRDQLRRKEVTVNAIAIETDETDLTAYFFEHVITGPGAFVVTAAGFEDYPEKIRRKLQREVTDPLSQLASPKP